MARAMDAYKLGLRRAIEARRAELAPATAEVERRRGDVVAARRTQKAWETLRERLETTAFDEALRMGFLEVDDLANNARVGARRYGNPVPLERSLR